jgi:hypothetical protein
LGEGVGFSGFVCREKCGNRRGSRRHGVIVGAGVSDAEAFA